MKKNKVLMLITIIISTIIIIISINYYNEITHKLHRQYLNNNFDILLKDKKEKDIYIIEGNIKNKGNKEYNKIKIIIDLYNKDNNLISKCNYETKLKKIEYFSIKCGQNKDIDHYMLNDIIYK